MNVNFRSKLIEIVCIYICGQYGFSRFRIAHWEARSLRGALEKPVEKHRERKGGSVGFVTDLFVEKKDAPEIQMDGHIFK